MSRIKHLLFSAFSKGTATALLTARRLLFIFMLSPTVFAVAPGGLSLDKCVRFKHRRLSRPLSFALFVTLFSFSVSFLIVTHCPSVSAATIEQLVAKQRQAMEEEIEKKLNVFKPLKPFQPFQPFKQRLPRSPTFDNDGHINAIYGINGHVTVEVSIGSGPSFPLTPGRKIQGWSIALIADSFVTFRHSQSGRTKTIYLAAPISYAGLLSTPSRN